MRNLFFGIVAFVFVLGLSGVAGAEEWIRTELKDSVVVSFDFPKEVAVQNEKLKDGKTRYFIQGTQPTFSMLVEFSSTEIKDQDYPLDSWASEKLASYLKEIKGNVVYANASTSYATFQGHRVILIEVESTQLFEVFVPVKGRMVHLVLNSRDSTLNPREKEHLLWKIISSMRV